MSDAAVHLPLAGELREQEHQLEGGGVEGKILNRCFVHFFSLMFFLPRVQRKKNVVFFRKSTAEICFFASLKTLCLDFYYFRRKPGIF